MDEPEYSQDEIEAIKDMIPRARAFDSLVALETAVTDPANEIVYALAPDDVSPVGYAFIVIKGMNKMRDLASTGGGYATELVIKCETPGEALWLYDHLGEKNILQ